MPVNVLQSAQPLLMTANFAQNIQIRNERYALLHFFQLTRKKWQKTYVEIEICVVPFCKNLELNSNEIKIKTNM